MAFFAFLALFPHALRGGGALRPRGRSLARGLAGRRARARAAEPGARGHRDAALPRIAGSSRTALGWGLAASPIVAFWSASRRARPDHGDEHRLGEQETRGFLKRTGLTLLLTVLAIVGIVLAIVALVAVPAVVGALDLGTTGVVLTQIARWAVLLGVILIGLAAIYRFGPSRQHVKMRWITPGSLVAAAIFILASVGFAFYVEWFGSYQQTFRRRGGRRDPAGLVLPRRAGDRGRRGDERRGGASRRPARAGVSATRAAPPDLAPPTVYHRGRRRHDPHARPHPLLLLPRRRRLQRAPAAHPVQDSGTVRRDAGTPDASADAAIDGDVPALPAAIPVTCVVPGFGAELTLEPGARVRVAAAVGDPSRIALARIDGEVVTPDAAGSSSARSAARFGMNHVPIGGRRGGRPQREGALHLPSRRPPSTTRPRRSTARSPCASPRPASTTETWATTRRARASTTSSPRRSPRGSSPRRCTPAGALPATT
ncbi:MAG: YihY/virulence factor BrkB family protein [Sandaracinaceae bacterium]|nr:YihY/virulence factor BrkB family protein [Sandaracinaceae bacterium]